jgi:hypothetical protein
MTRSRPTRPIVRVIVARRNAFVGLLLALVVAGCGSPAPSATPTATASPRPSPTAVVAATSRIGSFQNAATMNFSRVGATATLLNDGRVLIAGGMAGGQALSSAEVYDPRTSTFTVTGPMIEARARHSATLLLSGQVLLAGGTGGVSAEIYSPTTGKFSRTGSLLDNFTYHTATPLSDGRVLIAGGRLGDLYTAGAEIYNPDSGRFSRARYMKEARESAAATRLVDGRVLVAGGDQGYTGRNASILASAEVYDPFSGNFNFTGSMTDARSHFTATLLKNGRVLVVGGVNLAGLAAPLATAELFDPNTGTWSETGSMSEGRSDFTATLLDDGRVLIAGGGDNTAELYDPAIGKFHPAANMVMPRESQTATLLQDTRVLMAGGNTGTLAESYSP